MKKPVICIYGAWHLGCVTSVCIADAGFTTIVVDEDTETIENLSKNIPPILETNLKEDITRLSKNGILSFTTHLADAAANADIVWITFDTPVDSDDNADYEFVMKKMQQALAAMKPDAIMIISSQMSVGSTRRIEQFAANNYASKNITFAIVPENLRLGKSIEYFKNPDRFIVGVEDDATKQKIESVLKNFTEQLIFMSFESAEMTKHAINTFLASSVVFANELAVICEEVGADSADVAQGLKSEMRIGKSAYVAAGSAFSGGTLARDVSFLNHIADREKKELPFFKAIVASNDSHKKWVVNKLADVFSTTKGKKVLVLGLTYKPGTDTLRRSLSLMICKDIVDAGAKVIAYDPAINNIPEEFNYITLASSIAEGAAQADAVVVLTAWPEFKALKTRALNNLQSTAILLDPNRILNEEFRNFRPYYSIGLSAANIGSQDEA